MRRRGPGTGRNRHGGAVYSGSVNGHSFADRERLERVVDEINRPPRSTQAPQQREKAPVDATQNFVRNIYGFSEELLEYLANLGFNRIQNTSSDARKAFLPVTFLGVSLSPALESIYDNPSLELSTNGEPVISGVVGRTCADEIGQGLAGITQEYAPAVENLDPKRRLNVLLGEADPNLTQVNLAEAPFRGASLAVSRVVMINGQPVV